MRRVTIILLILGVLAAGCTVSKVRPVTGPKANPDSLAFLVDGETDRESMAGRLGEPSRVFESGRLVVYRLDKRMQVAHGWNATRFNLVLVFDERGVLQRHGLVRFK